MAISSSRIVSEVQSILGDATGDYWTPQDLLSYLNDALLAIVTLRPDTNLIPATVLLKKGTRQQLPDGSSNFLDEYGETLPQGIIFVDAVLNMGQDGLTPGSTIRFIDRELMDTLNPNWHAADPRMDVQYVVFDTKTPKLYYTYPPQPADFQGYIGIVYAAIPDEVTRIADDVFLPLQDEHKKAVKEYMLFSAYSADTDASPDSGALADMYYNRCLSTLGITSAAIKQSDPSVERATANIVRGPND